MALLSAETLEMGLDEMPDGSAHPDMQLHTMNARVIALVATASEYWLLAGDQLFTDLDLSRENLPSHTRLVVGTAVVVPYLA